jgi:NAD(P)-dependent dehydrogenase (short-subunit alcohol dehydrogenase family)
MKKVIVITGASSGFGAKAAMDALAVSYTKELARWGVETSIVIPGAFTTGTNHFAHSGTPDDKARMREYQDGPYAGFEEQALKALTGTVPPDADVSAVAGAIVNIVNAPFGKRPFRVTVDPAQDGSEVVTTVLDRIRAEFVRRLGFGDLLHPAKLV